MPGARGFEDSEMMRSTNYTIDIPRLLRLCDTVLVRIYILSEYAAATPRLR
jgi:hypothetical protein